MVQNNKVLTVSYGAFSCTLEGFEDSFETMKAIAEYFRSLSADDRYFGSEPPQPDTEMLTRIAQGDRARRVEAHHSKSGLLLRAGGAAQSNSDMSVAKQQTPSDYALHTARPTPANSDANRSAPAADSIAAKLQRIRAVVSHSDTIPATYSEDEDPSLLKGATPVDAVTAAFEAGALTDEDFQQRVPVPALNPEATEPKIQVPGPAKEVMPERLDTLFPDNDDGDEAEDGDMVNIISDDDEDTAVADADDDQGILTAEDEANLLDQISDVEKELSDRFGSDEVSDLDQDVSRLMAKAGEHMQDPSTSGARETYSHLRGAVAAAEAENKAGEATGSQDEDYRGDLASVVSPSRPEIEVTSMRPEPVASPLKLVAEQRVDTGDHDAGPVMPRRVKSQSDEPVSEESGFAHFAQEQGAQSLLDLLEAAAAYLSFVEGQEQFSRPQLMNKVRSLKQDEFNREESLRSFGQLLRDGKIERAGGGRFSASQLTGFRPASARAAG